MPWRTTGGWSRSTPFRRSRRATPAARNRGTTKTKLLPSIGSDEECRSSPRDEQTYRPAVEAICRRHDLPLESLRKYPGGSTIVFAVGATHVIKFFEPIFAEAAHVERSVLAHVQGTLAIPTPRLYATGDLEGWRYVIMGQLPGSSLADVWHRIPPPVRRSLCAQLGAAIAGLHALPLPVSLPGPDWPAFVYRQATQCVEQQRKNRLPDHWLEQIHGFLASQDLSSVATGGQVLLHTEIMREHVLVEQRGEHWALSGLFDFEPSQVGHPEYELASVGVFLAAGEPELLRAFLLGYGYPRAQLSEQLQERILLYALLHRYSNLRWYLERLPPRRSSTLQELAREWFAFQVSPALDGMSNTELVPRHSHEE